jgi:hypothetical protein
MPDRYIVQEICQVGVETTPGTAVAPTVRLQGVNIELDTALEVDTFAPQGNLFDTIAAPRQEWATGAVSGLPTYTELPYVFSNVFGAATVTTPTGATTARRWVWTPSSSTPWTPRTWTIRRGMVGNTAEQAAYAMMTGVGMSFSRTATPELSGDLFAQSLDYAATLATTGVTTKTLVPILPKEVCVYVDPTFAALGTTRMTRDFVASFEITDLFGPIWPLDCTLASFAAHAVLKPGATATLQLGNDTQGREPVTAMRAGDTRFVRIEATSGRVIDVGPPIYPYRLRIDLCVKVTDAPSRGDSDGLSTLEWTFGLFDDPSAGRALQITLDTDLTTL